MTRRLIFRAEAQRELDEAVGWYDRQRTGLGSGLLDAVVDVIAVIRERPQSFPVVRRDRVRRALVTRFPYGIYFLAGPESITVLAILHSKRAPRTWQNRR